MPIQEPTVEPSALSDAKRRLLAQRLKGAATPALQPDRILPQPPGARRVISPDQYPIWLDTTLQPDLPTYNEIVTIRYVGDLDPTLLEQSFNAFLTRHEQWRSTFSVDQGEVLQVVHPELRLKLNVVDLSALQPDEREAESDRLATRQALDPFKLDQLPLIRATLVKFAPDDSRIHLALAHIIFDGFSLRRVFLPELASVYEALAAGTDPTLPPVGLQYSDFAAWRHRQAESPAAKRHLDYWRRQLVGELPVLRLPTDRPRPAVITHRGDIERFVLSRELTESIRRVGLPFRASLYVTLLASLKTLLFRYSGQEDVIIGSVADGRRRPELEPMLGYILDVFALRSYPASETPFSVYLQQVKQTVLDALNAAEVPFERIVEALDRKRDLSHQPVFQTIFIIEPTPQPCGLWSIAATEITIGATKFDLYIEADEHPDQTTVSIDYSTELFDRETIRRMIGHWRVLLDGICANPHAALGDLPILTQPERELMLVGWNQTAAEVPATTMHGLFESQAAKTPNAPAVTFENKTLTYAQLDREANRIAHQLHLAGAAPDSLAAIFLDRSQYLVAGLLAILKTGAAYLPLDPATPTARIALCLEDAPPAVILTQRDRFAGLPHTTAQILILEELLAQPFPDPEEIPASHADPEALAYVIHTSGSTGRPKGVELKHQGVVNLLLSMQRAPGFTAADTLVAVTTISFDIAALEIFLPLITGGRVVIAARETALDPTRLAALLADSGCTVLQATPATWSALIGNGWTGQQNLKALCGGEALNRSLADRLLALNLELWNVYGPTETTIWSTIQRVEPAPSQTSVPMAVGRTIANTTAYILDPRRQPVPIGVPGELHLGGIGLARGYRNQPELTAQKFITPPVSGGTRLYRTGDNAIFRLDGTIELQGRADNQVKIRGYRIELEDVEVNLTAHPQVAGAAAKAWPDPESETTGGQRLCAYLVGVAGAPPSAAELRQFLRGRIADYMIPSDIVPLAALPLTANGKVDRNQLPPPEFKPRVADAPPLDHSTLTGEELLLANIWAELLPVDHIAASDNFFDLGGHSLMLLKLVRAIKREFAVDLPLTRIFQAPTLGELAASIRELTLPAAPSADGWNSLVPLNPRGSRRPLFLIHSLLLYGRLPAALGPDQPFYGLQQLPLDIYELEADPSVGFVDYMLEDHIRQIKRIQPHGPYQLAGWCFAGWMAYEVARRLESRGDQVSMLALLDSWCPFRPDFSQPIAGNTLAKPTAPSRNRLTGRLGSLAFKINFRTRQFIHLGPAERWGYMRRMMRDLFSSFTIPLRRTSRSILYRLYCRLDLPLPGILRDPDVMIYEWLRTYQLQPYQGDIALVRPGAIAVPPGSDPECGWRPLTSGRISSSAIPGDRSTMFLNPNLALLADHLRNLMKQ